MSENPGQLAVLVARWRDELAAWAIPEPILAAVTESPWVLPTSVFARRADQLSAAPAGASFERAWAALDPPGSVLDIGSGAGAASLPLAARTTELTAVDSNQKMLDLLGERAAARSLPFRCVNAVWPEAADDQQLPPSDVVTCHHVIYNVPDLLPFLTAMTTHARRQVVVELTLAHPLTSLNELWYQFHGLRRPTGPTAHDVLEILTAMGVRCDFRQWQRPGGGDFPSMAELVDVTRRRLCLPPERAGEVESALVTAGVDPGHPADLGSSGREVMTIWWGGSTADDK
ncbi:MAG TPA: class I SAM-dependent methyltransferase [Streptosporangiaceae bacterium]|nr:class I SAM-dependent methyltransferase [Streptosporangiaceae bacterium]